MFKIPYICYIEFEDQIKNDNELLNIYRNKIKEHNTAMKTKSHFDSGFDLYIPKDSENVSIDKNTVNLVSLGIKCACYKFNELNTNKKPPVYSIIHEIVKRNITKTVFAQPFKLFPRSSIWKNGVLLANSTGIIDSGYRGSIMAPLISFEDNNPCSNNLAILSITNFEFFIYLYNNLL